ncbi:hypothetical protein A3735_00825, partial [Oleiphilus sp. HI0061]
EAGFGTGLNFLLSWRQWLACEEKGRRDFHYISFEKHPLSLSDLRNSLSKWPELADLSSQLCDDYPFTIKGHHTLKFECGRVILTLVFGDIYESLDEYRFMADCWYLDGFSPNKNPEMWSPALFKEVARLSSDGATFSTFAAASAVRRGLESAGFSVKRQKGFGKKREMLLGSITKQDLSSTGHLPLSKTNWAYPQTLIKNSVKNSTAAALDKDVSKSFDTVIIGAGLAGISTASALYQRGLDVAIIDTRPAPVSGASGQSQLVMYAKFPSERNKTFNFVEHCLAYSLRYYPRLQANFDNEFWHPCGLLQLAWSDKEAAKQTRFANNTKLPTNFIRPICADESSEKSGLKHSCGGLWFENAGWLDPKVYAKILLSDKPAKSQATITPFYNCEAKQISQNTDSSWTIETNSGLFHTRHLVIANSNDTKSFPQLAHLPTKPLRGQVTSIRSKQNSEEIKSTQCVLTGEGYLCPSVSGWHHFGATFDLDSNNESTNAEDNEKNFEAIQHWNPSWISDKNTEDKSLNDYDVKSNAGLRCTTPDYLPIVGLAPNFEQMKETFAKLRVGANSCKHLYGHYYQGLYVNVGHGSKGALTSPVAAELIAHEICGGIPPVNDTHKAMFSPARFIIKHLKQRRI